MTNNEIKLELGKLIQSERENTKRMLAMLKLAEEQRAYLEFGYDTLFRWLTEGFKYAAGSAQRRLNAVRILTSVPEAETSLLAGDVNLSTLDKAQSIFNAQEKATGRKLSDQSKAEAIKDIENKSRDQAHKALLERFPEAQPEIKKPRHQRLTPDLTKYSILFSDEALAVIRRVKEVLSHKFPRGEDSEVFLHVFKEFLAKVDPLEKSISAAEMNRITKGKPSKAHQMRGVMKANDCGCAYVDPISGRVCNSRWQVQRDHVLARALGGEDTPENCRPLCRKHDILIAEKVFGKKHMAQFRKAGHQLGFDV